MRIYVEKLPKGCLSCPYIVDKGDYDLCAIKDCVIDDAFKYIDKKFNCCGYVEEKFEDIKEYILDQLQGESKCLN